MKINKLSISNFRSFKELQTIEFAPVTLLFGENSVGKSSVLIALFYLQQILNKGHCDPIRLDAMQNRLIGGFKSLIHNGNLDEEINIKVELDLSDTIGTEYETYAETIVFEEEYRDEKTGVLKKRQIPKLLLSDIAAETTVVALDFTIAWSYEAKTAYVSQYSVAINGDHFGTLIADSSGKNSEISNLNLQHPLLLPDEHKEWLERYFGADYKRDETDYLTEFEQIYNELSPSRLTDLSSLNKDDNAFAHIDKREPEDEKFYGLPREWRVPPVPVRCFSGSLPLIGQMLNASLNGQEADNTSEHLNHLVIVRALTQAFVAPLDKLKILLDRSICIGPLRKIPDEHFIRNPHPEQKDWMDGTAAWDVLHDAENNDLIGKVSSWFSEEKRFNSGYELISSLPFDECRKELVEVLGESGVAALGTKFAQEPGVLFRDKTSGMKLHSNQLGVGISQVLPVVVAANYIKRGLIAIEQPELHIHPSFQVELGDLFTQLEVQDSIKPIFLIETHSEHILLRLRKRIRQTTDGELSEGVKPVDKDDVAINYIWKDGADLSIRKIRLDEDGEFIDQWPKGFFGERMQELI